MAASRNALAECRRPLQDISLNSPPGLRLVKGTTRDAPVKKPPVPPFATNDESGDPSSPQSPQFRPDSSISSYEKRIERKIDESDSCADQSCRGFMMDKQKRAGRRWDLQKTRRLMGSRISLSNNLQDVNGFPMGSQDLSDLVKNARPALMPRSLSEIVKSSRPVSEYPEFPPAFPKTPDFLRYQDHVAQQELKPNPCPSETYKNETVVDRNVAEPEKKSVTDKNKVIKDSHKTINEHTQEDLHSRSVQTTENVAEGSGTHGEKPLRSSDVELSVNTNSKKRSGEPSKIPKSAKAPGRKPWEAQLNIRVMSNAKVEMAERSITCPVVQEKAETVERERIASRRHSVGDITQRNRQPNREPCAETCDPAYFRLLLAEESARMNSWWNTWAKKPVMPWQKKWMKSKAYVFGSMLHVETNEGVRKMKLDDPKTKIKKVWGYYKIYVTSKDYEDPIVLATKSRKSADHIVAIIGRETVQEEVN